MGVAENDTDLGGGSTLLGKPIRVSSMSVTRYLLATRVMGCLLSSGRRRANLYALADLLLNLGGSGLEPRGGGPGVGDGRRGNSLSVGVKTTHFGGWCAWSDGLWLLVAELEKRSCTVNGREDFGRS